MHNPDQSMGKSLAEILAARRKKLAQIKELGFSPYAYQYDPSHQAQEITDQFESLSESVSVKVAGRIMAIRKMGRANFVDIQDNSGKIQVYIKEQKLAKKEYQLFELLDIGDIIGVKGPVFKTRTGQITILTQGLKLLSKNLRPLPIVKQKEDEVFDAFSDKEQRYRQRYLDLIVNPEVKEVFRTRSKIVQWTRDYLNEHEYLEVETPVLQPLYGGASARPFKTFYHALNRDYYLRIADELYLKRLIIGGFDRVYELSKNFRNEGVDRNHNPEFTLLEFYQTYVDYNYMMEFVENYFKYLCAKFNKYQYAFEGYNIDFKKPFNKETMFQLLKKYVGQDLEHASEAELRDLCIKKGLDPGPVDHYGQLLDALFSKFVEPHLIAPTFVIDFPKAISPLAKQKRAGSDKMVERFELFIGGQEFANAFSELNDPIDQRQRLEEQNRLRETGDEEAQTLDEDFITAMEYGMPPTGGVGIGIDRVIMLFTNQRTIRDVLLFPQMRT